MEIVTITILAFALAADAFAVSVVAGAAYKKMQISHAFRMAAAFGLFQAVMPLIGAFAALAFRDLIKNSDHWIAFAILAFLGAKMIFESFKIKPDSNRFDPASITVVLALALATSIDALAAGITLSLISKSIIIPAAAIGIITFALSALGIKIGTIYGHFFENRIELLGGVVLILLGVKILAEHGTFAAII